MRIYTGAFRTSPVESLHIEAYDSLLELRKNKLGLRFLYKLKSNTIYTESLNTWMKEGTKTIKKTTAQLGQ